MNVVVFCHSLISDWNHGNAHFLRGVVTELMARGHRVRVYEPDDAWSLQNLVQDAGEAAIAQFHHAYPHLTSIRYDRLDLAIVLENVDLVLVHEWSDPELVRQIGQHRKQVGGYRLLFHDTHHRALTAPDAMAAYELTHYDGVLAFGSVIRDLYRDRQWHSTVWTWHEAADTRVFQPIVPSPEPEGDLVWIGNWGDEERSAELFEFLIEPVKALGLTAKVYGVRYPESAQAALRDAQIDYAGWLPNYLVPQVFARFRVTIHVPRRPYARALPGIPTIRPFEALACGIPLISAPWHDREQLFESTDFLVAQNGSEMQNHLHAVLNDADLAASLRTHGLQTVRSRHTCAHRVDQLLQIYESF